jgi:hypothetical protein
MKQVPLFDEPPPARRRSAAKRAIGKRARKLSQYYTPDPLAERIASFALRCCPNARTVLEPSAGRGAIVRALLALQPQLQITCVDLDVDNAQHLLSTFPNVLVAHADFLKFKPARFDLVVMNPPFEDGAVAEHVLHSLEIADAVVCHCPITTLSGQDRRSTLWSLSEPRALAVSSTRPRYIAGGGKTDMCTVFVRACDGSTTRDPSEPCSVLVEFWP